MSRNKFLTKLVIAAVVALFLVVGNSAKADMTLADLLQGGSIQSGDKMFYGFHDYSSSASGSGLVVAPNLISVSPYLESGEYGLLFQSSVLHVGPASTQDTRFEFFVRVLQPGYLIHDNTLEMTAGVDGDGGVHIAETVVNAANDQFLADKYVYLYGTGGQLTDHKVFLQDVLAVHVSKDIALDGGLQGQAFVSDFSQTFSQVPEPATVSMLAAALLALGGFALIRRRAA